MTRRMQILKDILWILAIWGLVAGVLRMKMGLGATTNLSDAMPWGMWKIFNMLAGAALSTSGFMLGIIVYVFHRKQFKSLVRPAIFIAVFGYGSSLFALLFDIGLPHLFWHPVFMWNLHSFLFEVFWCVSMYFSIAALESLPVILQDRFPSIGRVIHGAVFFLVVIGATLSTLHHSSLGSLFLLTPQRLHPLWFSPMIPAQFLTSAIGGGLLFLIFVRLAYAWLHDPGLSPNAPFPTRVCCVADEKPESEKIPELPALSKLAVIAAVFLSIYLVLKVVDLIQSGSWRYLGKGDLYSWLYLIEITMAVIAPLGIVAVGAARRSKAGLTVAGLLGSLGLALNRLDVGIFGFFQDAGKIYMPSLLEWSLSLGIVAAAGIVYLFFAEHLRLFDETSEAPVITLKTIFQPPSQSWRATMGPVGARRISLIFVIMLPLAFVSLGASSGDSEGDVVKPPIALDQTRAVLKIDGDRRDVATIFEHVKHQRRLGDKQSCQVCHHIAKPDDQTTSCWQCHTKMNAKSDAFNHEKHMSWVAEEKKLDGFYPENRSCVFCHDPAGPKSAETAKSCLECHKDDMAIVKDWAYATEPDVDIRYPIPYRDAMHGLCIKCHAAKQVELGKTGMDECAHCHQQGAYVPAADEPVDVEPQVEENEAVEGSDTDSGDNP